MDSLIADEHIETIAYKFRILSMPGRLEIINALNDDVELTIDEILSRTNIEVTATYKHLQMMFAAGVLGKRRDGAHVYYRIKDRVFTQICQVASNHWGDSE